MNSSTNETVKTASVIPATDTAPETAKPCIMCGDPAIEQFDFNFCCAKCVRSSIKAQKTKNARDANEKKKAKVPAIISVVTKYEEIPLQSSAVREALWKNILALFHAHFDSPEIIGAQIIFATMASQVFKELSANWLMAIAPSGSMKTAILNSLHDLPRVFFIDQITANTFLSGQLDEKGKPRQGPPSLLHEMGKDAILICSDFSTWLTLSRDTYASVMSQLRRIHDEELNKRTGSADHPEDRSWKGHITMISACTPAIDRQYKFEQELGERFTKIRWQRMGGVEAAIAALHQRKKDGVLVELRKAVHAFLLPILSWQELPDPTMTDALERRLGNLTELTCQMRAPVPRDDHQNEIIGIASPESNTRLPQEIAQIVRGWAVLMGRKEANEDDFALAKRACWDTMPPNRVLVLRALIAGIEPNAITELPRTTVTRIIEDLCSIGLVDAEKIPNEVTDDNKDAYDYSLSASALDMLEAIEGDAPEGVITPVDHQQKTATVLITAPVTTPAMTDDKRPTPHTIAEVQGRPSLPKPLKDTTVQ